MAASQATTQAPLYLTDNELEILTDALETAWGMGDLDATPEEHETLYDRLVMTAALRHPTMEPME
jgi:hypothetical protein